jgi:hypothetical protein
MDFVAKNGLVLAALLVLQAGLARVSNAEVCQFAGTTDHAGRVTVKTDVTAVGEQTNVDVVLKFDSTMMFWIPIHYLVQETSRWRATELESVAVNIRYLVGDHIVRQLWDQFQRDQNGLQAKRVQGKTLAEFQIKHPGFVKHWDPGRFGQSWLGDYAFASPERRADLDLNGSPLPAHLRSPLAMAFYWIRWLPSRGEDVTVFLPGFKADRLVHLPIAGVPSATGMVWQAPLHYPVLASSPVSTARAWTSPDGHLQRLAFEVHERRGSAQGQVVQEGCQGAPIAPIGAR